MLFWLLYFIGFALSAVGGKYFEAVDPDDVDDVFAFWIRVTIWPACLVAGVIWAMGQAIGKSTGWAAAKLKERMPLEDLLRKVTSWR